MSNAIEDKVKEFEAFVSKMIDDIQTKGADFTITYDTKVGPVGFTFYGAPFKGKTREVIDAQICWELAQLKFPE